MIRTSCRNRTSAFTRAVLVAGVSLLTALTATGASASSRDIEPVCVYYEDEHGRLREVYREDDYCPSYAAIAAADEEARGWPDYDPTRAYDEGQVEIAVAEAQGWPDYDPTRAYDEGQIEIAIAEARQWPDYDPTRAYDEGQIEIAVAEAQQWPDYDPTRVQTDSVITIADAPRGATVLQ